MKLISEYSSVDAAEAASRMLEEKGIATFVSSKHSLNLGRIFTGAFHAGLWVILDEQSPDASALLRNPSHRVSRRLTQSEIVEIRHSVHSGDLSSVLGVLFKLLLGMIAFVLIAFALTRF